MIQKYSNVELKTLNFIPTGVPGKCSELARLMIGAMLPRGNWKEEIFGIEKPGSRIRKRWKTQATVVECSELISQSN